MSLDATPEGGSEDRRYQDRRLGPRAVDLTLPEVRRIALTSALFLVALAIFVWMVRKVIIAGILGLIIAVFLRPFDRWFSARLGGRRTLAALLTLVGLIVPFVAVVLFGYFEVVDLARYLVDHQATVSSELTAAVRRMPWVDDAPEVGRDDKVAEAVQGGVERVVAVADDLPAMVARSVSTFAVAATIFLITAFYVLTQGEALGAYVRSRIPARYAELAGALETNVRGVLYGAIYSTLVTQVLKSAVLFVLFLLMGVPIAGVLAVASFVIGFFPIVGSWSVYLPVAVWLLVFDANLAGAMVVLVVGVLVNTVLISTYLRPKLAADKSHVLDFYWMLVGLVTGVYTFGLAGVVLGPIVIGVLKAILDTALERSSWRLIEQEYVEE